MKLPIRFLLTLLTLLCGTTIAGAAVQKAHAGVVFEKSCVLEEKTGFLAIFNAPGTGGGWGTTSLYRAINKDELLDIAETGILRGHPEGRSMVTKWFAESADDASRWGQLFYKGPGDEFFTLRLDISDDVVNMMRRMDRLDGIGPARSADGSVLDLLNESAEMSILRGNLVPAPR